MSLSPDLVFPRARTGLVAALILGLGAAACHGERSAADAATANPAPSPASDPRLHDAMARYDAATTPAERCTAAGGVVAAQAQAHNELALSEWKAKQAADCAALPPAGLSDT